MFKDEVLYGGHEELMDRINQLKSVISRCAKHGEDAQDHVVMLKDVVSGMENILEKYSDSEILP